MSSRGRYQGDGIGLVDDKGRVAIPAPCARCSPPTAAKANGKDGGTVVIGAHQKSRCLVAYDPAYVDILAEKLDAREAENTSADGEFDYNIKRRGAPGEAVPFDGSGRFIMPRFPALLRRHRRACLLLWRRSTISRSGTPRRWSTTPDAPEIMKAMARFYMAEKGVQL